jgi:hypothetical protein
MMGSLVFFFVTFSVRELMLLAQLFCRGPFRLKHGRETNETREMHCPFRGATQHRPNDTFHLDLRGFGI